MKPFNILEVYMKDHPEDSFSEESIQNLYKSLQKRDSEMYNLGLNRVMELQNKQETRPVDAINNINSMYNMMSSALSNSLGRNLNGIERLVAMKYASNAYDKFLQANNIKETQKNLAIDNFFKNYKMDDKNNFATAYKGIAAYFKDMLDKKEKETKIKGLDIKNQIDKKTLDTFDKTYTQALNDKNFKNILELLKVTNSNNSDTLSGGSYDKTANMLQTLKAFSSNPMFSSIFKNMGIDMSNTTSEAPPSVEDLTKPKENVNTNINNLQNLSQNNTISSFFKKYFYNIP